MESCMIDLIIWATIIFILWNATSMLVIYAKGRLKTDKQDPVHYKWDRE